MKLILISTLTLFGFLSHAQQNNDIPVKQNSISVTIGQNQIKDENLHPKVFHGVTIGSSFFHSRMCRNISEYSMGIKISALNTDYEDFPSAASIHIIADYRYLFGFVRNQNINYFLGPVADMQYGTSAYFNWDESHLHFANYLSGGIGARINYRAGNKSFYFNLDIPLISCIFRPEYNPQFKIDDMTFSGVLKNHASNPQVALPGKNFYIKTGLEMKYNSRRERTRSVGYSFRYHYMYASNGNPYQNIENNISYKFIFKP